MATFCKFCARITWKNTGLVWSSSKRGPPASKKFAVHISLQLTCNTCLAKGGIILVALNLMTSKEIETRVKFIFIYLNV